MRLEFAKSFEVEYKKIIKGNQILEQRVRKQLQILRTNINHPSLRLHKLSNSDFWSISIDKSIRVLIIVSKDWIHLSHIGKHEEVY